MKVLFIHHSTGANLIQEGNIREIIRNKEPRIEFWDHSYNLYKYFSRFLSRFNYHTGLTDNKDRITNKDFNITLSNNSPKEFAEIFSRDPKDETLKQILEFDIIAFKNCYGTTKIISDKQLHEFKSYYKVIRDSLVKYKDKKFILLTPPPLRKECTKKEYANRAKNLVSYLSSNEFINKTSNLQVFDFFGLLADRNGMLKKEYSRFMSLDSHPNKFANKQIAPIFADYIKDLV